MNSLQVSLAIAGGLILMGVIAYNTWYTRRNEPRQAQPEAPPSGDERQEPVAIPGAAMAEPERVEPSFDGDAALPPLGPLPTPDKRPALDALIDVIAPIALETVVSGDAALAALPATRRVGTKPFAVEGLNEATGEWEVPIPGQRYSALQAGLQLANRGGAINQIEYSEFVVKASAYAEAVSGTPEFPDMQHEVARARELDQFASEHDAQLGVNLRARSAAWSPGYVQQQAARVGFVPGALPGRMVLPGAQPGVPVLALAFDTQAALSEDPDQSAIYDVALSLDVPHVAREEQPLRRMTECAHTLASAMDADLIDDRGQRLSGEALEGIHAALEHLYDALDEHDLSAGSPQARRLFS